MNCEILLAKNMRKLFKAAQHNNVNCPMHLHLDMEIVMVTSGTLNMQINGTNYEISKNQAVFIPSCVPHSFASFKQNICRVFEFKENLVPEFFCFLKSHTPKRHLFNLSPELANYAEKILSGSDELDGVAAQALLGSLCLEIKEKCTFFEGQAIAEEWLYEVVDYMNKHFSENITLKSVAKAIGVHHVTLSKKFSQLSDISFPNYLNYLRCTCAADLIRRGNLTFTEIAYLSGYGTIRNFNRAFLSVHGLTPTQFKISINE